MSLPSPDEVQSLTRKHVLEADANGTLHILTPKVIRRQIETDLNLQEGDLDSADFRNAVKAAIHTTMEDISSRTTKKPTQKTQKAKKRASDTGNAGDEAPKKKPRASKKEEGDTYSGKRKNTRTVQKDVPPPPDEGATKKIKSLEKEQQLSAELPQKKRKRAPARVEDSGDEEGDTKSEPRPVEVESGNTDILISEPQGNLSASAKDDTDLKAECNSDSELSVLIDEPPKRKQKRQSDKDKSTSTKSLAKGKKKSTASLSKDEETIKKLKSLVVACGVRKVWSKVFQGLESPAQQIKKLKEILQDLGMTGRMSMEQAKAIKEKREFAQELQDVLEFEKAIVKSGQKRVERATKEDESDEDESEEEDPKPRRRKMNAAQSITAFLGDQSSDDD